MINFYIQIRGDSYIHDEGFVAIVDSLSINPNIEVLELFFFGYCIIKNYILIIVVTNELEEETELQIGV